MPPLSSTRPAPDTATRQKTTLFCPACGHESPADGDWELRASDAAVAYHCPVCDTRLTERPTTPPSTETPFTSPLRHRASSDMAFDTLFRSVRLALAWAAWSCPAGGPRPGIGRR